VDGNHHRNEYAGRVLRGDGGLGAGVFLTGNDWAIYGGRRTRVTIAGVEAEIGGGGVGGGLGIGGWEARVGVERPVLGKLWKN